MTPTESAKDGIVEFQNVTFGVQSDAPPILNNLNLKVFPGEILVLLGKSGCGKTTTLRMINRMIIPTSGSVLVEGRSTTSWDPIALRRRCGYVIQESGLFPHFTIERNIGVVPTLEGWQPDRIRQRVNELLTMVGLAPERFASRVPRELSGGQRQRVGVARALAADPPLMLMDEPFGALDPLTRADIQAEFAKLVSRLNKTVILVTHDVREALLLASRIGLMDAGTLQLLSTPSEFLESQHPLARAYLATIALTESK